MARIKLAYIGGGSTRAPGTMASFIHRGEHFAGSEVVLYDLNAERLDLVRRIAEKSANASGVDLRITATSDRAAALDGCDAVLTSFRPGGFEARHLDESIPLRHGIIGQETQGPGGFFMALRTVHVMHGIVDDMERICPDAYLFNYTNPVNIVSEAVTHGSNIRVVSLCEGPIIFPRGIARACGLDPDRVDAVMIGLNHGSWSVRHLYDGQDMMPLVRAAYEAMKDDPTARRERVRILALAAIMDSIPSDYFKYYYYTDEILRELQAKGTTRAQDIMASVPDYWTHYREQADAAEPQLDPTRSRGGIHELELAFDVMDAMFNDRGEVWPVNVTNNGAIPQLPDDRVVEVRGYVDRHGIVPRHDGDLPQQVAGLVEELAEYQSLAASAAWNGGRREAIWALAANPLVRNPEKAEALFDEMAHALRDYLPERLVA
jgi:6-phospho-beta-glucosidase